MENYGMEKGKKKREEIKFEISNGKVKEYSTYSNKLIFEGEYINGERFKGKEYD